MKTRQHHYIDRSWVDQGLELKGESCQVVLAFGSGDAISDPKAFYYLQNLYQKADIVLCSTAGEILDESVYDNSLVATAIELEKTRVKIIKTNIDLHHGSLEAGLFLMEELYSDDLNNVMIFCDGTSVNGSELAEGINQKNANDVTVTGGLAGDGDRFEKTLIGLNDMPAEGNIVAIGFYGPHLHVGHGSLGGWDEFGQERIITKSEKNVLYEIDHKNALELYKQYLGDYADELPGSALLFPLSIRISGSEKNLVRTILKIDEKEETMTFAGNLPEGSRLRLMKANFDKLIEAASEAATQSISGQRAAPDLALLISCVGRKLILQEIVEEEVQSAKNVLGNRTSILGFYSYGEISPFHSGNHCELHNQTMTITTLTEL